MSKHHYDFMGKGFNYVKAVKRLLGDQFTSVQLTDGVEFKWHTGNRILKLVDDLNTLVVIFDVPVPDLYKDNPIEVRHHHEVGHNKHEWIFKGDKIEDVYALIEIALRNFDPETTH
ncbi:MULTISPECIES: hypothetical protein [unclassified Fusibacter]|uniref:hypothetical protein n=1 Tax=unclassified Fusibacter TaxID=2624464 RepID=UPI001010DBB0|nr:MULTISPECIES: hypothetical protein [unclassified Fusibacter]MCK8058098.1 hypothetical protein [Fusibacter sp. A2]NPE20680.1 hypothetical protein [Fusibacter sp. A1]RXV62886.1 hypothetical protein DWB64_02515 [Fusibacter sp. A1]